MTTNNNSANILDSMSPDLKAIFEGDGSIQGKIHSKTLRALLLAALTPGPNQLQAQRLYWDINEKVTYTCVSCKRAHNKDMTDSINLSDLSMDTLLAIRKDLQAMGRIEEHT